MAKIAIKEEKMHNSAEMEDKRDKVDCTKQEMFVYFISFGSYLCGNVAIILIIICWRNANIEYTD